uniref:Retrotransposon gag domain-containing protein n=1 Tax=Photinus pyralis TaxID=7054 RepID=A0A1Y1K8Q9_PHOPY
MGPDNPIKEIGYEDLMKKFREMLAPQRKPVVSQHYFLGIAQKEHQSIAQFVATLRQSLSECEFYTTCECAKKISMWRCEMYRKRVWIYIPRSAAVKWIAASLG